MPFHFSLVYFHSLPCPYPFPLFLPCFLFSSPGNWKKGSQSAFFLVLTFLCPFSFFLLPLIMLITYTWKSLVTISCPHICRYVSSTALWCEEHGVSTYWQRCLCWWLHLVFNIIHVYNSHHDDMEYFYNSIFFQLGVIHILYHAIFRQNYPSPSPCHMPCHNVTFSQYS